MGDRHAPHETMATTTRTEGHRSREEGKGDREGQIWGTSNGEEEGEIIEASEEGKGGEGRAGWKLRALRSCKRAGEGSESGGRHDQGARAMVKDNQRWEWTRARGAEGRAALAGKAGRGK